LLPSTVLKYRNCRMNGLMGFFFLAIVTKNRKKSPGRFMVHWWWIWAKTTQIMRKIDYF
jgi:hypothetical protein